MCISVLYSFIMLQIHYWLVHFLRHIFVEFSLLVCAVNLSMSTFTFILNGDIEVNDSPNILLYFILLIYKNILFSVLSSSGCDICT